MHSLIEFNKGNYLQCLDLLKQVLQENPLVNPQVRFGMGLCYFRLGNLEKARFAFERVVELDEENSMAYVALAIVEL